MNVWMDRAVGGRQDRPGGAYPPGWSWRFLGERNSGERPLGDRHERRLRVWQIGTECLMKPAEVDGVLGAATRQQGGADVRAGDGRGEVRLERAEVFALIGRESGDDHTVHPELERAAAKRMGATTYELDSGHVPMLSQPVRVLDVICTAAAV